MIRETYEEHVAGLKRRNRTWNIAGIICNGIFLSAYLAFTFWNNSRNISVEDVKKRLPKSGIELVCEGEMKKKDTEPIFALYVETRKDHRLFTVSKGPHGKDHLYEFIDSKNFTKMRHVRESNGFGEDLVERAYRYEKNWLGNLKIIGIYRSKDINDSERGKKMKERFGFINGAFRSSQRVFWIRMHKNEENGVEDEGKYVDESVVTDQL